MLNQLITWDIENISYSHYHTLKSNFSEYPKKIYVHNNINIPIKPNETDKLAEQDWEKILVKPKKNSADVRIQNIIHSNLDNYNEFMLITADHGFSNIVIKVLKRRKKMILITLESKSKLIDKIYKKSTEEDTKYLKVIYV